MSSAGSDWVAKLGPIYRQNVASTRKQAEEGVMRKLQDAAVPMLTVLAPLHEIFLEGAVCPSGCAEPELAEIKPELEVFSYEPMRRRFRGEKGFSRFASGRKSSYRVHTRVGKGV